MPKLRYFDTYSNEWKELVPSAISDGINTFDVNKVKSMDDKIGNLSELATTSSNGLMSSADKTKLDSIQSGAEVNQNAFSTIRVGSTNIDADSKTDILELSAGAGITLTPDATNDKVTIAVDNTVLLPTMDQLWVGAVYVLNTETITPSKPLSQCRNGWLLVWSDYDPGVGTNDFNWAFTFIPKAFTTIHNNGGVGVPIVSDVNSSIVKTTAKYLYVTNTTLKGASYNNSSTIEANDVCLRYIYEF